MVFPFVWMLLSSFKDATQIYRMNLFPDRPTLENYSFILLSRRSRFPQWFLNSAIVAICTTSSVLFFDSLLGYTLSKFTFPGKKIVFLLIISTLMIPTEMLVIPWYALSRALKWGNTYWGVMFPGMISAFGVFLMRQFCLTLPDELLDAARIDGAGEIGIFWRVVLPLLKPPLASLAIITFLGSWNNFLWPLIVVSKGDLFTLPVGMTVFTQPMRAPYWTYIMAVSTVATLPVVLVFVALQKYFIQGVVLSGMKG
jgi:multiple sugar transport system permease protein